MDLPSLKCDGAGPGMDRAGWLLAAALCGYFAFCGLRVAHGPGLSPDECLFSAAARDHALASTTLFGQPVLLMPYLGALKTHLFAPVFAVLGASATTLRAPCIAISVVALLCTFAVCRSLLGMPAALFILALCATDASFAFGATVDFGPIVLATLLKVLALALVASLARRPTLAKAWALVVLAALGLWDKLSFLWTVAATIAGMWLCPGAIRELFRRHARAMRVLAGVLATMIVLALARSLQVSAAMRSWAVGTDLPWKDKIVQTAVVGWRTFAASSFYRQFTEEAPPHDASLIVIVTAALCVAGGIAVIKRQRVPTSVARVYRFVLAFMTVIFAQILLTPRAVGPHHAMAVWPMPHVLAGVSACALLRERARRWPAKVLVATAAAVLVLVGAFNCESQIHSMSMRRHYRPVFAPQVYALGRFLQNRASAYDRIVCVEWGVAQQLKTLLPAAMVMKVVDLWAPLASLKGDDPSALATFYRAHLSARRTALVFAAAGQGVAPSCRQNVVRMAERSGKRLRSSLVLTDAARRQVFAVATME